MYSLALMVFIVVSTNLFWVRTVQLHRLWLAGWWLMQALKPLDDSKTNLGEDLVDMNDPHEYSGVGDGVYMMHIVLSEGNLVQCVAVVKCDINEPLEYWQKSVAAEDLKQYYYDWPPRLNKSVVEVSSPNDNSPIILPCRGLTNVTASIRPTQSQLVLLLGTFTCEVVRQRTGVLKG